MVCLTEPADPDNIPFTGYEIYDEIRARDSLAVVTDNTERKTIEQNRIKKENKRNILFSPDGSNKSLKKRDKIRKRG